MSAVIFIVVLDVASFIAALIEFTTPVIDLLASLSTSILV
jgi:hypothetical protein